MGWKFRDKFIQMENEKLKKVFTTKMIWSATYLGGPLAAGILMSKNYKVFGKNKEAGISVFLGIIFTIILFVGIFLVPEPIIDKIPMPVIPLVYSLIIVWVAKKLQGKELTEFLKNNGHKASYWAAIGYSLISLVIILIPFAVYFFSGTTNVIDGYSKKVDVSKNITLYYDNKTDDKISKKLAKALKISNFNGGAGADLFLNNEKEYYKLTIITEDLSLITDTFIVSGFNELENAINLFVNAGKPVEIYFSDPTLKKTIVLPKLLQDTIYQAVDTTIELLEYNINSKQKIFYNKTMPSAEVEKLGKTINNLKGYFSSEDELSVFYINKKQFFALKFYVKKALWNNRDLQKIAKGTVEYLKSVGTKKDVKLFFIDGNILREKEIK